MMWAQTPDHSYGRYDCGTQKAADKAADLSWRCAGSEGREN